MTEHIKTPELRFSNFLDMWHIHKLSDVATITGGGTPSTKVSEYWNGEIDWYTPNEIGERIYAKGSKKKITNLGYKKSSTKLLPVNTILFTSRAGIGNTAILAKEGCTNQGFQSIIPNSEKIDSYFIYTISNHIKKYALKHAAGSTFLEISGKELGKMKLFLPSLKEQQKIGVFFSKLDHQIELEEQKLEKLEEQKKGYMQQIFSQELRFKDENGNNYPEWIKTNLKYLVNYKNGKGYEKEVIQNGKYNIINLNSISTKGKLKDSGKYSDFEDVTLKKNDLIMILSDVAKGNLIGKTAIIDQDDKYLLNQRVACLRIKDESTSNTLFIYYFINYFRQYFINMSTGMSQLNINKSTVEDFLVYLPYIEEQNKIGNFLSNYDKVLEKQSDKIELLKERKKGLLQKMFV